MARMTESVIAEHDGVEIRLNGEGQFYGTPKGGSQVKDNTLAGLKKKLDNVSREKARESAKNLPAIVLEYQHDYEGGSDRLKKAVWIDCHFVGVNAHTGDVKIRTEDGRIRTTDGRIFRRDEPALEEIRALVLKQVEADRLAGAAKKAVQALTDKHGRTPRIGYARDSASKTKLAAELEDAVVQFLSGQEAEVPNG